MKKVYLLLLLCCICIGSYAQVVVNEGFEHGGSLPTGWSVSNTGGYNWAAATVTGNPPSASPHSGSYLCWFNSWNSGSGTYGLLSTPIVDWSTRSSVATSVTVWVYRDLSYCSGVGDALIVYVNTSNSLTGATNLGTVPRWGGNATSGGVIGTSTTSTSGWYQYSFPVPSSFNSNTNYIIFEGYSAYGACSNIDDVSYTAYPCPNTPIIAPITSVCPASTIALTDATTGGRWSTGSATATVGSLTGIVTGVSAGAAVISYTASCGAVVTTTINVSTPPATPSGNIPFCQGSTITLTDGSGAGTWSGTGSVASIVSSTGVVNGLSAGTQPLTFTLTSTGCQSVGTVTVNALPSAIAGSLGVCNGGTSSLSSTPTGGTWLSTISGTATINSSGLVTAIGTGTSTISYTAVGGCSTSSILTVNPQPVAITGISTFCGTQTTTLASSPTGGTWTSGSAGVATAVPTTGVITGAPAGGTAAITYTLGSCSVTGGVTVNPLSAITGLTGMCIGSSITLSDGTAGGTWTSNNPIVATIGSTSGIATSVSTGSAVMSYTIVTTGCTATYNVTVTPPPSIFLVTGGGSFCASGTGAHIGLSSSTIGVSYQAFIGTTATGAVVPGTGFALDLGSLTTGGTYSIIAYPGTTCAATMYGTATVTVNPLPTAYSVTGGGGYCASGSGVHVGLITSDAGINYQLFKNGTILGAALPGTGTAIDFGLETTNGTYTVTATNSATGCTNAMTGSAIVTVNALPSVFTMTGGGGYCPAGTGVTIGLSSSTSSINYQLLLAGTPTGLPVTGSGSAISFGLQTATGIYTVVATNTVTACTSAMSGSKTVSVNPLPTVFNVTGGGIFCAGGTGVHIGLDGSGAAVNYQLYNGSTTVGSTVSGTGSSIDFGLLTAVGTYTVSATSTVTTCSNNMNSSATVTTNALPVAYTVLGGGNYCTGGTGIDISLSSSDAGISYQLYRISTPVGAAVISTGGPIDFGNQTAGTYNIVATNTVTGCTQIMTGTPVVLLNPLPIAFNVTGGGSYCAGSTSTIHVGLSSSTSTVSYKLFNGGTAVGVTVLGTGSSIDFGVQSAAGIYTVLAAAGACPNNMTGSASININPQPTVYVVGGGGGYCSGTTGAHITLNGSDIGISYQLYSGTSISGIPIAGTGSVLDLGAVTAITTYTVSAVNSATGCTNNMTGSTTVSVNALPTPFPVTVGSGGVYCAGGVGVPIGLSSSTSGISYQLYLGGAPVGAAILSSGGLISFGNKTAAGTYSVVGSNPATTCASNMTGTVTVSVNPLPVLNTVTGGGAYCSGSTTGVHVTLTGSSTGTTYVLYNSGSSTGITVPGTGSALDFGAVTVTGPYTVIATTPLTTCSVNMLSSVFVTTNPVPATATVTGGGTYCIGGTGVAVSLSGSVTGINYQLYNGSTATGSLVTGTGTAISFGLETGAGSYTVIATNAATHCTSNMTASATVSITSTPIAYTVTGGGGYCPGSSSVVGLGGSLGGVNYILYLGGTTTGISVTGGGGPITFGPQTATGTYTVLASDPLSTCSGPMAGSVSVSVNPSPAGYALSGGGSYCAGGAGLHVGVAGSQTGISYQLYNNGSALGSALTGTGSALDFGLKTAVGNYEVIGRNSTTSCSSNMSDTVMININPLPFAFALSGGGNFCSGTSTGAPVNLTGSATGTNYQLYNGTTAIGTAVAGTSAAIFFGTFTTTGVYSITATNTATGCSGPMANNDTITVNPLPALYAVTGGGNYCSGGTGSNVGLASSQAGITYQLYNSGTATGSPMTGTGSAISFGLQTATGVYTITAANNITGCTRNMTGSTTIGINPLPSAYSVTGGGSYCASGAGVLVGLSGSAAGISYQLFDGGIATGSAVAATGSAISFGLKTGAGSYTVVGTNTATGCSSNMTGSAAVSIATSPNTYVVSGSSAGYCAGGTGVRIYSSGSDAGVFYQLYRGTSPVGGAISGTSTGLDFGAQTTPGTYTVIGTETIGGCSGTMTGSPSVVIDPVPNVYTVTGGGNYCTGTAGVHIGLSGSQSAVSYQLILASTATGSPVTGTGSPADFGAKTTAGTYTVVAATPAGCTANMSGSATITIAPLPAVYTATGSGSYCSGGTGLNIGLSGSATGTNYQLYYGSSAIGGTIPGTGLAIDLGTETAAGVYTVTAINATTGCTAAMTGVATVSINALPTAYAMTGGGNYCAGTTGVHIGLSSSDAGISYRLYNGSTLTGSAITGTGTAADFGLQTATGLYTVTAVNSTTGCTANMSGTEVVGINALPTVYNVTGGGNYCTGTTGLHIRLSGSTAGIDYQLFHTGTPTGPLVIGSGGTLDMGASTTAGSYTVTALNSTTGCTSNMAGSAAITVTSSVVPSVVVSAGGDNTICAGLLTTFSATVANGGSSPAYQWSVNSVPVSTASTYSYLPLNGDVVSVAVTSNALCAIPAIADSSITMTVLPQEMPGITISANPGTTVCQGTPVTFSAIVINGGTTPAYQWKRNGASETTAATYTFVPVTGDVITCDLASNYRCRLASSVTSAGKTMEADAIVIPDVVITADPGANIANGQTVTLTAVITNGVPAANYQWYLNGHILIGATSSLLIGNAFSNLDNITCQVTANSACAGTPGTGAITLHVSNVGVQQVATGADIQLTPNPNKGTFNIKGALVNTDDQEAVIEITDMVGRTIYNNKIMTHSGIINQDIQFANAPANGMYIVSLHCGTEHKVFHMVIEQ